MEYIAVTGSQILIERDKTDEAVVKPDSVDTVVSHTHICCMSSGTFTVSSSF